jgi:tetratricopeptide (TPR) repeat protein
LSDRPVAGPGGRDLRSFGPAALVALLTAAVFAPVLSHGFVDWDDALNFLNNPNYRGLGAAQLKWMWTTFHAGPYMPLTWMSHGLDYLLWGMDPRGYHLGSLLLHSLNASLLFLFARRLYARVAGPAAGGSPAWTAAAALAALVFSLHPLRAESVAWATERRDVLSGFFFLISLLAYLRHADGRGRASYAVSVGCFVAALLSKAAVMGMPVLLVVLDVWPLRRFAPGGVWSAENRRLWREKVPFVLAALLAAGLALHGQRQAAALTGLEMFGLPYRVAQAAWGAVFYVRKTLVPTGLCAMYELPYRFDLLAGRFVASFAAAALATVAVVAWRKRHPWLAAAWFSYLALLAPVSGLAQSGMQMAADRYSYFPGMVFALCAGGLWAAGASADGRYRRAARWGSAAVLVFALGALARAQAGTWRDTRALWTRALAVWPSSTAHNNLANVLMKEGDEAGAVEHYRAAVAIRPVYADARFNLGVALGRRGELRPAAEEFEAAARLRPDDAAARYNLGCVRLSLGELAEADRAFAEAVRVRPDHREAWWNRGAVLLALGRPAEAAEVYARMADLWPGDPRLPERREAALRAAGKNAPTR